MKSFDRLFGNPLFVAILIAPFCEPVFFADKVPLIDNLYFVLKLLVFALLFMLVLSKYKLSLMFVLIALLQFYLVIDTSAHGGATFTVLKVALDVLGLFIIAEYGLSKNPTSFLKGAASIYGLLAVASLLVGMTHPDGLYMSDYATERERLNAARYLFGNKNDILFTLFPGIICGFLYAYRAKGGVSLLSMLTPCAVFINVLIVDSKASLVICGAMMIFALIVGVGKMPRMNPNLLIAIAIGINAAIVLGAAQSLLADSVGLLGRDLTFSSRTYIWDAARDAISHSPIFGFGVESSQVASMRFLLGVSTPHNFLLAQMYYGGALGLLLTIAPIFLAARHLKKGSFSRSSKLIAWALFLLIIQGTFESMGIGLARFSILIALSYQLDSILQIKTPDKRSCVSQDLTHYVNR